MTDCQVNIKMGKGSTTGAVERMIVLVTLGVALLAVMAKLAISRSTPRT